MYYRVAIQRPEDQLDRRLSWQWKSTVLSSLQTVLQFLRLYGAPRHDDLRVFSCCERVGLEEQLRQENLGLLSPSVTAAQFLHERLIHTPEGTPETPKREAGADRRWQPALMGAIAARNRPALNESGRAGNGLVGGGMSALERRRLGLELGPGGDHDVPYRFVLPASLPQVFTWMRLLARIQRGELQV
jgi:hypothetical protein